MLSESSMSLFFQMQRLCVAELVRNLIIAQISLENLGIAPL